MGVRERHCTKTLRSARPKTMGCRSGAAVPPSRVTMDTPRSIFPHDQQNFSDNFPSCGAKLREKPQNGFLLTIHDKTVTSASSGAAPSDPLPRNSERCLNSATFSFDGGMCVERQESQTQPPSRPSSLSDASLFELICVTSFNFPYGFVCGTFGLWILPAEALRLFPSTQSLTLGISLGIVGISQLVCPIAGKISDLHQATTRFGKRRPYILYGSFAAFLATFGMRWSSLYYWGISYYFFLFVGMTSLNIAYAVQCGLVPDILNEDLQGRSSGFVAVHTLLGSGSGFALVMLTSDIDFHFVYILYVIMVGLACVLTCWIATTLEKRLLLLQETTGSNFRFVTQSHEDSIVCEVDTDFGGTTPQKEFKTRRAESNCLLASEATQPAGADEAAKRHQPKRRRLESLEIDGRGQPTPMYSGRTGVGASTVTPQTPSRRHHQYESLTELHEEGPSSTSPRLTWSHVVTAFSIDLSESYDFFWVFLGRALYYIGVSVQAFMLYFLRDVVGTSTEAERQYQIGCLALLAQFTAASVAYPVGAITDRKNIGKKPIIYLACLSMSIVYLGFLLAPLFGQYAFNFMMLTAIVYGAGNGCFLAVDYALALATLPKKENTTQALGIWGVAAFLGSAIGPLLWGTLIEACGKNASTGGYDYSGYVVMLLGGVLATLSAGGVIALVRNTAA